MAEEYLDVLRTRYGETLEWYVTTQGEFNFLSDLRDRLQNHKHETSWHESADDSQLELNAVCTVQEATHEADAEALEAELTTMEALIEERREKLEGIALESHQQGTPITEEANEALRKQVRTLYERAKDHEESDPDKKLATLKQSYIRLESRRLDRELTRVEAELAQQSELRRHLDDLEADEKLQLHKKETTVAQLDRILYYLS